MKVYIVRYWEECGSDCCCQCGDARIADVYADEKDAEKRIEGLDGYFVEEREVKPKGT